jgi:hypothetical protein
VPTIRFQILYVFLVLAHERRRIVHFNVRTHPTAERTAQQLREAFPGSPRHAICSGIAIGSSGRPSSTKCRPWESSRSSQHRVHLGSGPMSKGHRHHSPRVPRPRDRVQRTKPLPGHLQGFMKYYRRSRRIWGLHKDAPEPRSIQSVERGQVTSIPGGGGLHHRYERRAA